MPLTCLGTAGCYAGSEFLRERNGPEFEARIRQNEINNPKFNFLNPNDPYHAYYRHKVSEFKEGKAQEPSAAIPKVMQQQQSAQQQLPQKQKELSPTVMQNMFQILIPPKGLLLKLKKEAENPKEVLDQVYYRVEWAKFQERERKKEEEEKEKERVAYAQIDWHDFVVVETVDFQPNEQGNFPPPTTPEELGARILIQERYEKFGESEEVEMEVESDEEDEKQEKTDEPPAQLDQDTQVQDMDEGSDDEDEGQKVPPPPETPMPPPLPPTPDQVIVRKDYDPKASKPLPPAPAPDEYLVSPITGEKIPASKMQEHMRIGLLDPRWLEQRDRSIREKQSDDEVYAPAFVPAPPVAPVPSPAPMPPVHPPPPMEDEPVSKKLKSEDSLIPEEEFLRRNKGPVTVKVQVPNMQDKTEWKLNGQVLVFTLPLSDQVSVIKVKIHEATGMPAGKQKLQYEVGINPSNPLRYFRAFSHPN
ncbi:splicing factor 3a subunit 1 [Limosa lapponica baueri]|uniref:Splicing factor 3a subunit 1 n=1 Tax=Limosa lapponica baueri TaxID=1758121 RepID=A0A2I0T725_LIMLA|nr:splicing factor 3a subunit 1 [Limosa lapponica baueri]